MLVGKGAKLVDGAVPEKFEVEKSLMKAVTDGV